MERKRCMFEVKITSDNTNESRRKRSKSERMKRRTRSSRRKVVC